MVYHGQCAELCGRNHANMYGRVIGMPFDGLQGVVRPQAREIQTAKEAWQGRGAKRSRPSSATGRRSST